MHAHGAGRRLGHDGRQPTGQAGAGYRVWEPHQATSLDLALAARSLRLAA